MNDAPVTSVEIAADAAVPFHVAPSAVSADGTADHDVRDADAALPGYRLDRLEVLNWGTFDGAVHVLVLDGQTTLLVGQNGSGKSTLVDALLTLLVRPGKTRNYNLAAGANKTERTEKSYILGAFDRRSQADTNRGQVQHLRSNGAGATTYSVLLACFRNRVTGRSFTLAQVLYLSDGGVEKVYCFAGDDRSIAHDFSGLKGMDRLTQETKRRGFKATTKYSEYFEWFRKATGVKEQAMDMFNQTVAVKDIQRLNDFIRKHMLEAKPWSEKVDELFKHFDDLSDAHRELERVRQERDLLEPIEKHGAAFRAKAHELDQVERLLAATYSYFPRRIIDLLEPEIARRQTALERTRAEKEYLKAEILAGQETCRRIKNEIEQAGGERMRQIPLLIDKLATQAAARRSEFNRLSNAFSAAGINESISDAAAFDAVRARLGPLRQQLQTEVQAIKQRQTMAIEARVDPFRSLQTAKGELEMLRQRQGNLPRQYVETRQRLCEELRLAERDVPFVAEMIAVKPDQRDWESSIEMVLRGFALSLLVPRRHYLLVSRYMDRTQLRDSSGHGLKLVYLQVAERERQMSGSRPDPCSLFHKLDFREGWSPLLPWVKAEVQERHNFRCCDTVEEFQQCHDRALTRQRHVKFNSSRHEKDDRDRVADPRHYVLGWDNRDKKQRLADEIEALGQRVAQIDTQATRLEVSADRERGRVQAVEEAERFKSFHEIDFAGPEREIAELRVELQTLEQNNDTLRMLKQRLAEAEQGVQALEHRRDQTLKREQALDTEIANAEKVVERLSETVAANTADGSFAVHADCFAELDRRLAADPISLDNFAHRPEAFRRVCQIEERCLRDELKPLEESAAKAMARFLNARPDGRYDLGVSVHYLSDYLQLLQRIKTEDLPRFESAFKERLVEKVGQEIGVLRGSLNEECTEIADRIELLNLSLRQVPFGNGSHMRLVAKPVRDPEVATFRRDLDACVNEQFEGTLAADEARFKRIETLITRLRAEDRWQSRVTDVRNWFDFAAVETDDATGEERSYNDDSAGQSGGEKAKLAFTILIAAIAFQYDLDPERADGDRFHFVAVDEMFSRVDDGNSAYALKLFRRFGLQLLIVAPLDAKARVTEDYVGCYLHVSKDEGTNRSQVLRMTAREFADQSSSDGPRGPRKSR